MFSRRFRRLKAARKLGFAPILWHLKPYECISISYVINTCMTVILVDINADETRLSVQINETGAFGHALLTLIASLV